MDTTGSESPYMNLPDLFKIIMNERKRDEQFLVNLIWISENAKDLQSIKLHMHPFLQKIYKEAIDSVEYYFNEREKYNIGIIKQANGMMEKLKDLARKENFCAKFIMTSSVNAGINLVGDPKDNSENSDVDISMTVDWKEEHLSIYQNFLAKLGFVFKKLVNPSQPLNRYHSFILIENGIEYEVKVRDRIESQTVLKLHEHMEKNLTHVERAAITYGKLIFKIISKNGSSENEKIAYILFKKLVYEMYFADIEGGFILELHY